MKKYFLLLMSVLILTTVNCNPRELPIVKETLKEADINRTEATEDAIKNNPELQELDNACKQIPLPDQFKMVAKHLAPGKPPALSYYYFSNETFDDSDKFFKDYFQKNGWKSVENKSLNRISEFRNDNNRIVIQYGGIGVDANYSIFCEKLSAIK